MTLELLSLNLRSASQVSFTVSVMADVAVSFIVSKVQTMCTVRMEKDSIRSIALLIFNVPGIAQLM